MKLKLKDILAYTNPILFLLGLIFFILILIPSALYGIGVVMKNAIQKIEVI